FFAEYFISEEIGETDDGLLDCANALHHVGPLAHELPQLLVSLANHFDHMRIVRAWHDFASVGELDPADFHEIHPPSAPRLPTSEGPEAESAHHPQLLVRRFLRISSAYVRQGHRIGALHLHFTVRFPDCGSTCRNL